MRKNNNKIKYTLTERYFDMDNNERAVKGRLIGTLKNDGMGHKYPKAAERIKRDYAVQIVDHEDAPDLIAAINPETNMIYISDVVVDGLFSDDIKLATYIKGAVCMLLRHELGHSLLKHFIREFKLLEESAGKEFAEHVGNFASRSMSHLLNVLEDLDLDKLYSPLDRTYVKEMKICGQTIHGLLPELYAKEWKGATLENMWKGLQTKIDTLENEIRNASFEEVDKKIKDIKDKDAEKFELYGKLATTDDNYIRDKIMDVKGGYKFDARPSRIPTDDPNEFVEKGCLMPTINEEGELTFMPLNKKLQVICKSVVDHFNDVNNKLFTEQDIIDLRKKIANSSILQAVDLFDDKKCVLYSPEEKAIAQEMLKLYKTDYQKWYDKFNAAVTEFIAYCTEKFSEDDPSLTEIELLKLSVATLTDAIKDSSVDKELGDFLAKYLKDTYNYDL